MRIATCACAAVIAFVMGMGAASAENKSSEMANSPVADSSAAVENSFDLIDGVPGAIKMPAEQLSEIVGGTPFCGPMRRRWFNRFHMAPSTVLDPCEM